MDVGVRELKQRLSEMLDRAQAGETVVVTDRGRRKAMIVPIRENGRIAEGIAEGWLRPALGAPEPVSRRRFKSKLRVLDVLAEDRDE